MRAIKKLARSGPNLLVSPSESWTALPAYPWCYCITRADGVRGRNCPWKRPANKTKQHCAHENVVLNRQSQQYHARRFVVLFEVQRSCRRLLNARCQGQMSRLCRLRGSAPLHTVQCACIVLEQPLESREIQEDFPLASKMVLRPSNLYGSD